ncbi:MAG: monovalent cation/H+ antiporter subunit A [Candidatus Competibacter sp.]|nr:monovalent cation/H+ antiporter subunit A [Candidatus Competibacter sp.]MDG4607216.1 monovalent cation/H+ antiporter subunit A [Candidatus Contendobacter sp.]HRD48675.1 monovalent cation/H+ antiporter subunit A [Candidatus Contendobacter sp.]
MLPFIPLMLLLSAVLPPLAERHGGRNACAWATAAVTALALAALLSLAPAVFSGAVQQAGWEWLPELGLNLNFRLDGLGLLFGLLITGIGLLVILYACYYLSERDDPGRFYSFLLLFMGAMLGIVLADNLLLLLMFWELTSLGSFLLIGYWHPRTDARRGARLALTVTAGGGLALLGGFLLLGHIVGSFELSVVLAAGDTVKQHPDYLAILLLIVLGVFTKSAQFPLHFWLPQAMAAPTPVSAYLHSATMVKAGVFLLARLFPVLADTDPWFFLVGGVGLLTLLFAAYAALFQHDIKGLLAYSTVSHLGLITLLFGLGTPLTAVAGVFHIINHAVFKASLFMAAGIIEHETGCRDMRQLNGLFKYMPQTAMLAIIAAAAMAGVPLLNGFLSKEMFFAQTIHLAALGEANILLPVLATVAGVFSVAYSARFIHDVFFNGDPINLPRMPHEPPRYLRVPVEILVAVCLLVGIAPAYTVGPILAVAAASVVGGPLPPYSLALWHGFNLPLLMSALALAGGACMYWQRHWLFRLRDRYPLPVGKILFGRSLRALIATTRQMTGGLENGALQRYLTWLLGTAILAGALGLASGGKLTGDAPLQPLDLMNLLPALLLAAAALLTVFWQRQRLTALIMLGVAGLVVVLAFVRFSAPDLALTQLTVEVVTTVLLLLALRFLPPEAMPESSMSRHFRDAVLAISAGLGVAALAWGVLTRAPHTALADYFLATSLPGGGGANVVNVILVDFRGFDTLGEATVLAIAALGIVALLAGGLPPPVTSAVAAGDADRYPLLLRIGARPMLAATLLLAAYIFLRGHNLPGGGFIAGLVTALGLVTQYLAGDFRWTTGRLGFSYQRLIAAGLLLIALTGMVSVVFGWPFLTSAFAHLHFPLIGEFEIASAMAFDLGVYLIVVGVVLLILLELGRPEAGEGEWNS